MTQPILIHVTAFGFAELAIAVGVRVFSVGMLVVLLMIEDVSIVRFALETDSSELKYSKTKSLRGIPSSVDG